MLCRQGQVMPSKVLVKVWVASASAGTEGSNRSKGSNIWRSLLKTYIHTYIHTNTNVYVYVYFFYLVYCVSCTPRQRRVVMFTLGLLRLLQLGGTVLETPPARQIPFVCVLGFGVPTVGSRPVVVSGYRSGATAQPQVLRYSVGFPCVVWFSATTAPPSGTFGGRRNEAMPRQPTDNWRVAEPVNIRPPNLGLPNV